MMIMSIERHREGLIEVAWYQFAGAVQSHNSQCLYVHCKFYLAVMGLLLKVSSEYMMPDAHKPSACGDGSIIE
jgi:hypothetical protein